MWLSDRSSAVKCVLSAFGRHHSRDVVVDSAACLLVAVLMCGFGVGARVFVYVCVYIRLAQLIPLNIVIPRLNIYFNCISLIMQNVQMSSL